MKNLSRKEAMEILNGMKVKIEIPKAAVTQNKRNAALDMAINALNCSEIPNNSDTISRQAAIDKITKRLFETAFNNVGIKQDIDETLVDVAENRLENWFNELPPIQPERKKPVFKTGESVYHVSYADGTGGFEKNKWADWTCPDCGWFVGEQYIPRRRNQQKCNYCAKCGCAIDWSDADMRGEQE